ncbi:MAG: hypothetical protein KJ069_31805 [Anaerolineae bacterium]|nr:hypothetical protein [Anaerolineae bacterium]
MAFRNAVNDNTHTFNVENELVSVVAPHVCPSPARFPYCGEVSPGRFDWYPHRATLVCPSPACLPTAVALLFVRHHFLAYQPRQGSGWGKRINGWGVPSLAHPITSSPKGHGRTV